MPGRQSSSTALAPGWYQTLRQSTLRPMTAPSGAHGIQRWRFEQRRRERWSAKSYHTRHVFSADDGPISAWSGRPSRSARSNERSRGRAARVARPPLLRAIWSTRAHWRCRTAQSNEEDGDEIHGAARTWEWVAGITRNHKSGGRAVKAGVPVTLTATRGSRSPISCHRRRIRFSCRVHLRDELLADHGSHASPMNSRGRCMPQATCDRGRGRGRPCRPSGLHLRAEGGGAIGPAWRGAFGYDCIGLLEVQHSATVTAASR